MSEKKKVKEIQKISNSDFLKIFADFAIFAFFL